MKYSNNVPILTLVIVLLLHIAETHSKGRHVIGGDGVQPLSRIAIHRAVSELHEKASIKATPYVLGTKVVIIMIYAFSISTSSSWP